MSEYSELVLHDDSDLEVATELELETTGTVAPESPSCKCTGACKTARCPCKEMSYGCHPFRCKCRPAKCSIQMEDEAVHMEK